MRLTLDMGQRRMSTVLSSKMSTKMATNGALMNLIELVQHLEEGIVFGAFPPGSRLIEERLVDRFEVSRHMLRQAFSRLGERGLLVHTHNRGTEVVELTPDEVDDLYEVRKILETNAARMTRLPVQAALIDELRAIQERHELALSLKDFRGVFYSNIEFHRCQYSACSNRKLADAVEDYSRRIHFIRAIKYDDNEYMRQVVVEHRNIITAMTMGDVDAYVSCVEVHLPASGLAYRRAYEARHGIDDVPRRA